jgi:hypothetical protein
VQIASNAHVCRSWNWGHSQGRQPQPTSAEAACPQARPPVCTTLTQDTTRAIPCSKCALTSAAHCSQPMVCAVCQGWGRPPGFRQAAALAACRRANRRRCPTSTKRVCCRMPAYQGKMSAQQLHEGEAALLTDGSQRCRLGPAPQQGVSTGAAATPAAPLAPSGRAAAEAPAQPQLPDHTGYAAAHPPLHQRTRQLQYSSSRVALPGPVAAMYAGLLVNVCTLCMRGAAGCRQGVPLP